jgi:hypothetical protein
MGDAVAVPEVFTLVPREDRQRLTPEGLRWLWRIPLNPSERPRPPPAPPTLRGLVFRRWPDGRVTADGFPDEPRLVVPRCFGVGGDLNRYQLWRRLSGRRP